MVPVFAPLPAAAPRSVEVRDVGAGAGTAEAPPVGALAAPRPRATLPPITAMTAAVPTSALTPVAAPIASPVLTAGANAVGATSAVKEAGTAGSALAAAVA